MDGTEQKRHDRIVLIGMIALASAVGLILACVAIFGQGLAE